jgi:GMP reductase
MEIFDYDNILLLPRKCRVESRSECDASVSWAGALPHAGGAGQHEDGGGRIHLRLDGQNGYFYVMHRFDLDNVQFVRDMQAQGCLRLDLAGRQKSADYATVDQLVAEGLCPNTSPSTSPTAMPTACRT